MKIVKKQAEFLQDVAKLIQFIFDKGFIVTGGELFRPYDMQLLYFYGQKVREDGNQLVLLPSKKRSWTKSSKHLQRLAIDLNFFIPVYQNGEIIDYELTYDKDKLIEIGEYWESLNEKNRWGGFWKTPDTPHFQRLI